MTPHEKRRRRRQWDKLIRMWKTQPQNRKSWQIANLDAEDDARVDLTDRPVAERIEYLMRLCWMNYGPDALYGRLERVYTIGSIPPAQVPHRRRNRTRSSRPAPINQRMS